MLKRLNNIRAQAVSAEYVLLAFIVVGMITGMSFYFRRALQAQIRDARLAMVRTALERTEGYYNEGFHIGYEPYYAETNAIIYRDQAKETRLLPAANTTTGITEFQYDEVQSIIQTAPVAPPREAD